VISLRQQTADPSIHVWDAFFADEVADVGDEHD
jgi:hypothetical protein